MNTATVIEFPMRRGAIPRIIETDAERASRLETEKQTLVEELALERVRRRDAEHKVEQLTARVAELETLPPKRKRRTKAEMEAAEPKEYSEVKSDGKRKARPAEPIRSYEDFVAIQKYFLERGKVRDWAMWTIGVSLGLRVSDLLSLKIHSLLNDDKKTFRKRLMVLEQKTSKLNNCLITESVVAAATRLFDSMNWQFELDDYLFKSNKTKGKMFEEYGWKILSDAGKALDLPIVIGSHTMRKSFANIAACVDKSCIDMNSITKIQGLLNHADQRVTMRYLGTYQQMFDKARQSVSDFVLGKTDVHDIVAGTNSSIKDVIVKLEQIEQKLSSL